MAAITEEQVEAVRALVAAIPAGRVSTYGDIADAAGLSSPRIVGGSCAPTRRTCRGIASSPHPAGRPPHLATPQLELLRAEGVLADDGRVRMRDAHGSTREQRKVCDTRVSG